MEEKKRNYLAHLNEHTATPSQKDVWGGLSLLQVPLKKRQIFDRPTEPEPNLLSIEQLLFGTAPQPFDASVQEPNAVRDHFLLAKQVAEDHFPSLRNKTSTSSS